MRYRTPIQRRLGISAAREKGAAAAREGKSMDSNPYPVVGASSCIDSSTTACHKAWKQGWMVESMRIASGA